MWDQLDIGPRLILSILCLKLGSIEKVSSIESFHFFSFNSDEALASSLHHDSMLTMAGAMPSLPDHQPPSNLHFVKSIPGPQGNCSLDFNGSPNLRANYKKTMVTLRSYPSNCLRRPCKTRREIWCTTFDSKLLKSYRKCSINLKTNDSG